MLDTTEESARALLGGGSGSNTANFNAHNHDRQFAIDSNLHKATSATAALPTLTSTSPNLATACHSNANSVPVSTTAANAHNSVNGAKISARYAQNRSPEDLSGSMLIESGKIPMSL